MGINVIASITQKVIFQANCNFTKQFSLTSHRAAKLEFDTLMDLELKYNFTIILLLRNIQSEDSNMSNYFAIYEEIWKKMKVCESSTSSGLGPVLVLKYL